MICNEGDDIMDDVNELVLLSLHCNVLSWRRRRGYWNMRGGLGERVMGERWREGGRQRKRQRDIESERQREKQNGE